MKLVPKRKLLPLSYPDSIQITTENISEVINNFNSVLNTSSNVYYLGDVIFPVIDKIADFMRIRLHTAVVFIIDGGGSAITTGVKGYVQVPFTSVIRGVTLLADRTGSIKIDIWKDTYANFPPTNDDTITGGNEPEISNGTKDLDITLTSWTTPIARGDVLAFNVDSCATIQFVTIELEVQRA